MHIWSGKTYFNQGKIREISGNFIPQNLWPPCIASSNMCNMKEYVFRLNCMSVQAYYVYKLHTTQICILGTAFWDQMEDIIWATELLVLLGHQIFLFCISGKKMHFWRLIESTSIVRWWLRNQLTRVSNSLCPCRGLPRHGQVNLTRGLVDFSVTNRQ